MADTALIMISLCRFTSMPNFVDCVTVTLECENENTNCHEMYFQLNGIGKLTAFLPATHQPLY